MPASDSGTGWGFPSPPQVVSQRDAPQVLDLVIDFVAKHGPDLARFGVCPLYYVAQLYLPEPRLCVALKKLVTLGCDPDGALPGSEASILRRFVFDGNLAFASALLEAGANVDHPRHSEPLDRHDNFMHILEVALRHVQLAMPAQTEKVARVAINLVKAGAQMGHPSWLIDLLSGWFSHNEGLWDRFDTIRPLVDLLAEQSVMTEHATAPQGLRIHPTRFIGPLHLLHRSGHTSLFGRVSEMLEKSLKGGSLHDRSIFAGELLFTSDPSVFEAILSVPTLGNLLGEVLASESEHTLDGAVSRLRTENMHTLASLGILQRMCAAQAATITGIDFLCTTVYFSRTFVTWFGRLTKDHRGYLQSSGVQHPAACLRELGSLGLPLRTYLAKAVTSFPADIVVEFLSEKMGQIEKIAVMRAMCALSHRLRAGITRQRDDMLEDVRRIYFFMCQHGLDFFVEETYVTSSLFLPSARWGVPGRLSPRAEPLYWTVQTRMSKPVLEIVFTILLCLNRLQPRLPAEMKLRILEMLELRHLYGEIREYKAFSC